MLERESLPSRIKRLSASVQNMCVKACSPYSLATCNRRGALFRGVRRWKQACREVEAGGGREGGGGHGCEVLEHGLIHHTCNHPPPKKQKPRTQAPPRPAGIV